MKEKNKINLTERKKNMPISFQSIEEKNVNFISKMLPKIKTIKISDLKLNSSKIISYYKPISKII